MKKQKKSPRIGGTHADNPFQKARLNAGHSQEEASEKLSCAPRTLQRYESGETTPDYPMLRRMIDAYKCEAADLFATTSDSSNETGGGKR